MRYLFRQVLLRDVVYDMQLRKRLQDLHRRAAAAIEELHSDDLAPYYAELAYHYGQAGLEEQERRYSFWAGQRAAQEYANEEAVNFLTRALDLTPEEEREEWGEILLAREELYSLQGNRLAQRRDLQTLLFLAQGEQKALAVLRQAQYAELAGNYTGSASFAQRAVKLAQRHQNVELETAAYLQWGRSIWRQGRYHEAAPYIQQSLDLARQAALPLLEAEALRNLGNIYWCEVDYSTAMEYYQQALPRYRALKNKRGESAVLNNIGIVLRDQAAYAQARHYSMQALKIKEAIGDQIGAGIAYASLGEIEYYLGRYEQSRKYHQRSLFLSREAADSPGECGALLSLGRVAYQQGYYERAREYSQASLMKGKTLGDLHVQGYVYLYLGRIAVAQQDFPTARDAYRQSLARQLELNQLYLTIEPLVGLAEIELLQGKPELALPLVEQALSKFHFPADINAVAQEAEILLTGAYDPFYVYLTCYRVWQASHDSRAEIILRAGALNLRARAEQISEPELRRSFLENVFQHRELLAAADNLGESR
ncbi:MAG: tetratricopeptide repeat protein [Anaerolineae bacterium]|nr:tetratricopeptide repeat protein [Anaerolineae bacterium]